MFSTSSDLVVEVFSDDSAAFVFRPDPLRIYVLNRQLAAVLDLFSRADPADLEKAVAAARSGDQQSRPSPSANALVAAVERLKELDLVQEVSA